MASIPGTRSALREWVVFTLLAGAWLVVRPWGGFGWPEWLACLGPLALGIDRRLRFEALVAVGLPGLALLVLLDGAGPIGGVSALRMLELWAVFSVGAWLGARCLESRAALETIAGRVGLGGAESGDLERFDRAVERELARSRRHERPFTLLSVAPDAGAIDLPDAGGLRVELYRAISESRSRLEVEDWLRDELHAYCEVVAARDRVLALVPEVDEDTLDSLRARLESSALEQLDAKLRIGAAIFPRDALCAETLVQAADKDRTTSRLERPPGSPADEAPGPKLARLDGGRAARPSRSDDSQAG